ncbi:biogenesis of lysosome-related organelles complex 1 subunit 5 isoform X2 [Rhodnius prolixus]|uniref:biogenesis of lysosome-related organelles complex 1 subunit 5 isoform X2 n=1 Tax=Rhodnius prolixus TaxID=13249 RepID=UPI003D189DD5
MSVPIIKDCGEIWNRLFDHRPFLNGEIKVFLKEFEESRGDREISRLFEIHELVTDFRDTQIPKTCEKENTLNKLNVLLDISLQNCAIVNENKEKYSQNQTLEAKRALRKTEWENFMKDIRCKYSNIDKTFKEKEDELKEFYDDLEKKLHVN